MKYKEVSEWMWPILLFYIKGVETFFCKAWEIHNFTASAISLQGIVYERQKKVTVTRRVLTKKKFLVNNLYCHNFIFSTKKFDYHLILGS